MCLIHLPKVDPLCSCYMPLVHYKFPVLPEYNSTMIENNNNKNIIVVPLHKSMCHFLVTHDNCPSPEDYTPKTSLLQVL